jgi:PPM family protein phosphatase
MRVTVTSGATSHVGHVREHNEDAMLATDRLYAVADGMGGHAAGEVASAIAIDTLVELDGRESLRTEDVVTAVVTANERILEAVAADRRRRGMGTTLTGVALVAGDAPEEAGGSTAGGGGADGGGAGERWLVFNVGDSRVYRLADGVLEQLTVDHSEVQQLVDAGLITSDEASVHPARNIITRSLGMVTGVEPDVWRLEPTGDETYLVCSDGLTNEVDDDELAAILGREPDPQAAADRLCAAALEAGGRDNITVVVARATAVD